MTTETKRTIEGVILIIIICLTGLFVVILETRREREETAVTNKRIATIDSLKRENENLRSKALKLQEGMVVKDSAIDALKLKKNDILVRYKYIRDISADTSFVYITDSLNQANEEIIDTLEAELDDCMHVVSIQDEILRNDSVSLVVCEDVVRTQRAKIEKLERGWWDRNKFWVGLASGLVVGGAGAIAVMK